jgi:hypothetical protein
MAKIDISLLKAQAVNSVYRADLVRRDPAVITAGKQFGTDARQALSYARRALSSGGDLVGEVRKAWMRADGAEAPAPAVRTSARPDSEVTPPSEQAFAA